MNFTPLIRITIFQSESWEAVHYAGGAFFKWGLPAWAGNGWYFFCFGGDMEINNVVLLIWAKGRRIGSVT